MERRRHSTPAQPDRRPLARHTDLVVRDVDDGLLVYDLITDECISLAPDAAAIWRHCDGTRDRAGLAELLSTGPDQAVVTVVLEELRAKGLLDESTLDDPAGLRGLTRREMILRLGVASAAVPLITTLAVPTAVAAASAPSGPRATNPDGTTTTTEAPSGPPEPSTPTTAPATAPDTTTPSSTVPATTPTTTTPATTTTTTTSTTTTTPATTTPATTTPATAPPTTTTCTPSGEPCDFFDPGACCSQICMASPSGPVCV